jgi:hypothetical protein
MKLEVGTFNTLPSKNDNFWQVVLIPTISVLNNIDRVDDYIAVNFEWLFWSATFIITNNGQRNLYTLKR